MSVTHYILPLGAKEMKLKCFQYNFFSRVLVALKKNPYDMTYIAGISLILDSSKDLCVLPGCLILQSKIISDMRFHFSRN